MQIYSLLVLLYGFVTIITTKGFDAIADYNLIHIWILVELASIFYEPIFYYFILNSINTKSNDRIRDDSILTSQRTIYRINSSASANSLLHETNS